MRLLIAMFVAAVIAAAATGIGMDVWQGSFGRPDPTMQTIHYHPGANSDVSARRREPVE
jgi:hypothetical protein